MSDEYEFGEAPTGVFDSGISLEELAEREGSPWQALAKELVAVKAERALAAEREAAIDAAEQAIANGVADFTDTDFLEGLRQRVLLDRQKATDAFYAARKTDYERQFGEDTARIMLDNDRAAMAQVETFTADSGDPLLDSHVYQLHLQHQAQEARSRAFAQSRNVAPDFGLAEASAEVAATYAAAAGEE